MCILHWISGHIREDKIRNECIREKVGITTIVEKIVESRLSFFACLLLSCKEDLLSTYLFVYFFSSSQQNSSFIRKREKCVEKACRSPIKESRLDRG